MKGFRLKPLELQADKVIDLELKMSKLTDEQLRNKTEEFKDRYANGESLNHMLVEAFAVMREASFRVLGKKHYKVQIIGGIVLHQGRVAEMKTGEGKTLTELLPAYLNALTGKGVHIATVNDYLAKRDKEEMEGVFNFLGMSVGLTYGDMPETIRKVQYERDITYSTNSKLGFDYLFDNLVYFVGQKTHRKFNYCILDEVDSILIDEANSPLIISGDSSAIDPLIKVTNQLVLLLEEEDVDVDLKQQQVALTEAGLDKIEKLYSTTAFEGDADFVTKFTGTIGAALKAHFLFRKDEHYKIVKGKIEIIDQGTGRVMEGRRFSEGLHSALEAKEGLEIQPDKFTQGQITYQHFFLMYDKLSGMSGTVKTNEEEFKEIYNLDIIKIPTNKPIKRVDKPDRMFTTEEFRMKAVLDEIIQIHSTGRPILVGTPSDKKSMKVSKMLKKHNISHRLLNTNNLKDEAAIISKAGMPGAITVATNVAGRGTDIKVSTDIDKLGGLAVIATERAQNRRIDNQLIGRSGRQGSNGSSQFFTCIEDEIYKQRYGEDYDRFYDSFDKFDGEVTGKKAQSVSLRTQLILESLYYGARKDTVKYQDTVNKQREIIFSDRDAMISEGFDFIQHAKNACYYTTELVVDKYLIPTFRELDDEIAMTLEDLLPCNRKKVYKKLYTMFIQEFQLEGDNIPSAMQMKSIVGLLTREELVDHFYNYLEKIIDSNYKLYEDEYRKYIHFVSVHEADANWMYTLGRLTSMKKECVYASLKQVDPVLEYNQRANKLFDYMIGAIKIDTARAVLKYKPED